MSENNNGVNPKLVIVTKPKEVKQSKQAATESAKYSKPINITIKKKK